jgi:hypothetical protein
MARVGAGFPPQSSGRPPKGCGEASHRDGSKRSNETVMSVCEVSCADDLSPDDASDYEAILIGIVGGLIIGFSLYAFVIRAAYIIFGPEKRK